MADKEWQVEFTITGKTSFYCNDKKEAEAEAHKYLSELCRNQYVDCCDYEIEDVYTYEEDE